MNAVALPGLASGRYCAPRHGQRLAPVDLALVILFLLGLYLGVSLQITQKIPLTCAPSGFAGLILLWRRRDQIEPTHLAGLFGVVVLYLGSILSATDYSFLDKRFTGLVQLTYSLVISYALFVTLIHGNRDQIAWVLFGFSRTTPTCARSATRSVRGSTTPAKSTMPICATDCCTVASVPSFSHPSPPRSLSPSRITARCGWSSAHGGTSFWLIFF
jgi:hypothetical protein